MKAAIFYGPYEVKVEERDIPDIEENEVLIRVRAAGICGSDLNRFQSGQKVPQGTMFGHELSGEVVKVGKNVSNVSIGDRVAVEPLVSCGKCLYCLSGVYHLCPQLRWVPGFVEFTGAPWNKVYRIPDHITYEEAAILDCVAVCVHAINISGLKAGDSVTVFGDGTIGLLTTQIARLSGAGEIYVIGTHDFNLSIAKALGADAVINIRKENILERMTDLTGKEYISFLRSEFPKGTDYVFDAVGGRKSPLQDAINIVRRGGTIVSIGSPRIPVDLSAIVYKEVKILGSWSYAYYNSKPEFQISLDFLSKGKIDVKRLITHVFPLEKIEDGFKTALRREETKAIKIIIKP